MIVCSLCKMIFQAVATAAALSDRFCLQSNGTFTTPLSHQKLVSCTPYNQGCQGGYLYDVFRYLQQNGTVTGGEYESDEVRKIWLGILFFFF